MGVTLIFVTSPAKYSQVHQNHQNNTRNISSGAVGQDNTIRGVPGPENAFRCNETVTFANKFVYNVFNWILIYPRLLLRPPAGQPGSSTDMNLDICCGQSLSGFSAGIMYFL